MKYLVTVTRTATRTLILEIDATNEAQARYKGYHKALDTVFPSEAQAFYEIEGVSKPPIEKLPKQAKRAAVS